ncbi:DUF4142 domain-containing protein [Pseudomonas donghuensis]|uniref:DUF4142 domain-containing protein n=1 Tax=Pseudomonas donghuensis TaxID=1163398 RepID=UPI00215F14D8|nr:DUF4142 domain-containing protein [Pseudomonas donghuensis]MBF4210687.1 DUF4142 domain-containing protein [Pseudomonas donghuensis]UVL27500.1 DUF4142 domain-containing protein [Pseudomonas donghuensis]
MNPFIRPIRLVLSLCVVLSASTQADSNNAFVSEAIGAGMAEIQTSQLALEKTQSPQVKAFAQQMIKDHTKANQHLLDLAKQHGFSVPDDAALTSKARKMMLQVQDGASFDAAYATHQVDAHEQAVRLFDEESRSTSDPDDLRTFAKSTLATLKHHLEMAKQLQNAHRKN